MLKENGGMRDSEFNKEVKTSFSDLLIIFGVIVIIIGSIMSSSAFTISLWRSRNYRAAEYISYLDATRFFNFTNFMGCLLIMCGIVLLLKIRYG